MISSLISNDFLITVVMALVVAILGFPFVIVILLLITRAAKKNVITKKK